MNLHSNIFKLILLLDNLQKEVESDLHSNIFKLILLNLITSCFDCNRFTF